MILREKPRRSWTTQEDAYLRQHYASLGPRGAAKALGRTRDSVFHHARKLGLRTTRYWAPEEIEALGLAYQKMPTTELARQLGRTVNQVWRAALLHGLARRNRPTGAAFKEFLLDRHRDGWCDPHVAKAWGVMRKTVEAWRHRLGLPFNGQAKCELCRKRTRETTRKQCQEAGVKSLADVRTLAFRQRARAAGWPEDLRPRAVQMLDVLWQRGPMTRKEIAAALEMPWKGSRKSLVSNDPEGSYLAHLQARGLVVRLGRVYTTGYHYETYYMLALDAEPRKGEE